MVRCDLLRGLPFADETFDVVYHSHVLEHLEPGRAAGFLRECWRVLETDGILRVVVPDLENIARIYLERLERVLAGDAGAEDDYDWVVLELLDQMTRTRSGGRMAEYLARPHLQNPEFVLGRMGRCGVEMRRRLASRG